ncbi:MAG: LysR family transcriptional regulator [Lawsonibacter sp.]
MRDFDWQIIVTLHKTHNITKTAELLFISQPTLTKRIQVIEDELGIPLIVRSRRGSEFTPEGERIARKAEAIVMAIQEIKDDVVARNKGLKGILRLGVPYSYVRYVLPALLARYAKQYPSVEADIITTLSDELVRSVEDDALDLCFARYNAEDSYLERVLVSEDQIYAVYNRPFTLDELPDLPFIEFSKNPATVSAIQRWWNEHFPVSPNIRFKVTTGDSCISMVQHGLGYSIFPDPKYFQYESGLYSIPLDFADGTKFTRKTWLLYKKSSERNPIVTNFISFISGVDVNHLDQ